MTTVGAYSAPRKVTDEDLKVFNEAMEGFVGVEYTPLTVSTQIVNGTNYRFECTARPVVPNPKEGKAIVQIYKPINGKAEVTEIKRLD